MTAGPPRPSPCATSPRPGRRRASRRTRSQVPSSATVADLLDAVRAEHGPELARVLARCSYLLDEVAVRDHGAPDRRRHQPGRPAAVRRRLIPAAQRSRRATCPDGRGHGFRRSSACTTARVTTSAAAACSANSSGRDRRRAGAGGQPEDRVAVHDGVHGDDRAGQAVVAHRGQPGAARLVQREVGGDDGERRGRARRRAGRGRHGSDRRRPGRTRRPPPPAARAAGPVAGSSARADGVEHDQRGDRRAAVEHRAGRTHPALPPADDGARARPDARPPRPARRSRRRTRPRRWPRVGRTPNAPPRPRSNTTAAGTIGTTPPGTGNPMPAASRRAITPSAAASPYADAAGEHDGVDALDGGVRAEQVGLAGAGCGAAHVGPRDGALGGDQHDRGAATARPRPARGRPAGRGRRSGRCAVRAACVHHLGRARPVGAVRTTGDVADVRLTASGGGSPVPHWGQKGVPCAGAPQPVQAGGARALPHWPQNRPAVVAPQSCSTRRAGRAAGVAQRHPRRAIPRRRPVATRRLRAVTRAAGRTRAAPHSRAAAGRTRRGDPYSGCDGPNPGCGQAGARLGRGRRDTAGTTPRPTVPAHVPAHPLRTPARHWTKCPATSSDASRSRLSLVLPRVLLRSHCASSPTSCTRDPISPPRIPPPSAAILPPKPVTECRNADR